VSRHSKELRQQHKQLAAPSGAFQITAQAMRFTGPLPPPEILSRYNDAIPGGAERILAMAENQSQHRQTLEKQVVDANCRAQRNGSVFGFLICLAAIGSGTFLIYVGKSAQGLVPIIGALGGLVAVFVIGKYQQKKDLDQKATGLATTTQPS
jgi:uncharacterized membrane protein